MEVCIVGHIHPPHIDTHTHTHTVVITPLSLSSVYLAMC